MSSQHQLSAPLPVGASVRAGGADRQADAGSREQRAFDALSKIAALLVVLYIVTLVPGVRPEAGYDPLLDGWFNKVGDGVVVSALLARALLRRRERAGWLLLAAGLASALVASVGYYAHYQFLDQQPRASWSDIGWVAFYPLVYAGVLLLMRVRMRHMLRSLWFDGLIAGLASAAVSVAYLGILSATGGFFDAGLIGLYPIGDLLLLSVSVAVVVILGRATDAAWLMMCGAFLLFVAADAVYADRLATYEPGGPLDIGWQAPRLLLVGAAYVSARRSPTPMDRTGGLTVVVVPAASLVVSLVVLFHGTVEPLPRAATVLAFAAGVAVLVRTAFTFREVGQLARTRQMLRTDELTGLSSRHHFHDMLDGAAQELEHHPIGIVVLDINGFKQNNETLGHEAGDEILRVVAARIAHHARSNDTVSRLGGDEFALLLRGASTAETRRVAEQVRESVRRPILVGAATVLVDASLGFANGPSHSRHGRDLLRMADLAMHWAKRKRMGVAAYETSRQGAELNRLERVTQLRDALHTDQIFLEYQPQVDVRRRRTTGVEALVRWRHPTAGVLTPDAFIDLAESSGLVGQLTLHVLAQALGQRRTWDLEGLPLRMSVNVSPSVLSDPEFARHVAQLLSEHAVAGSHLTLEITEELLVSERDAAVRSMSRLRDLGVRFSIDDYGTGYASIGYLKDLPVEEIKLDRHFVADMGVSDASATIVRSTVELAHSLGLSVVAEGVEDVETLELVRLAGADEVQGYYLSAPVPSAQLPGAIRAAAALVGAGASGPHRS